MVKLTEIDETTSNIFERIFNNFNFSSMLLILSGIILGVLITVLIIAISTANSLKEKKKVVSNEVSINEEELKKKIEDIKLNLIKSSTGLSIKDKMTLLKDSLKETLDTVAYNYYPNSKHPLFELSVDEIIMLLGYIEKRLDQIFDKKIFKPFRSMTISKVLTYIDFTKKIEETKIMKAAKKANVSKIASAVKGILNVVNPVYWIKKGVVTTTTNFAYDKLASIAIDIVADETNKTYSKSVFNKDEESIFDLEEDIYE